ncbi:MAG: tetratricopeptide repeat protein [Bacteroidota bacterium]
MIKKILYLSMIIFLGLDTLFAQKNAIEKGIIKSEEQVKLFNAQQRFYAGDPETALKIYTDVLSTRPNDAGIIFHIAECYFEMGKYAEATENAEKAKKIDPKANENTLLLLGKLYHKAEKLDEALAEFTTYKTTVGEGKKLKESNVEAYITQVTTAKEMIAKPVEVKINNAGDVINSEFDDKAPSISADGKTLIFTSRRPGRSSELDLEGDKKHFEDIYISRWDTVKRSWSGAELIPGSINTDGHDACTSISPDGKQIFIYKNDAEGESRGGDIYSSRLSSSNKWGAPSSMGKPINTTYWEGGACVSPDGKTLYLVTERPGGLGHGDIYMVNRKTRTEWDTPVNMGADVNTAEDEGGIFLAPDGKTLFFSSKGHGSMGGYDIFKTVNENGKWSKPIHLGYPINTINNDMSFTVSIDAQTGYFSSDRKGGLGERDIYLVSLANYPVLEKDMKPKAVNTGPIMGILKGDVFDASKGSGMEAEVVIYDETGAKVGSTMSDPNSGQYFITLLTGKTYQVKLDMDGYKPIDEKVEMKPAKEGTTTIVKHYLLYKK